MNKIKSFETFLNEGAFAYASDIMDYNPNGKIAKVTITLESSNPDSKYGATVEGIADRPFVAGLFALSKTWEFIEGNNTPIENNPGALNYCKDIIKEAYSGKNLELTALILSLCNGEIEEDHFSDHGTTSRASVEFSEVPAGTLRGGFVVDSYDESTEY
jgi:hypothetical protein